MASFTSHKGSWGDRYIIEQPKNKRVITCSDCTNYCEDGSCMVQPIVISEVGYNYWRHCKKFVLASDSITEERSAYVKRIKGLEAIEQIKVKAVNQKISSNQMNSNQSDALDALYYKNIVQPNDKVRVMRIEDHAVSCFKMILGVNGKKTPKMTEECLGRKLHERFVVGHKKYQIIEIIKMN